MNKILWITDYILSERLGGAEIDDNKLIGMISIKDIAKACMKFVEEHKND